jgi:hypothetical protein
MVERSEGDLRRLPYRIPPMFLRFRPSAAELPSYDAALSTIRQVANDLDGAGRADDADDLERDLLGSCCLAELLMVRDDAERLAEELLANA